VTINKHVIKSTLVGALGGLLFGFDTAVIAGTTSSLTHVYGLSPKQLGFTVSIALVGTVIGSLTTGSIGQKYGGRRVLRFMAALYILSALGCAFAWSWPVLLIARFLGGLGIGGSSVLGPVYIAELAPAKLRGRLVGTFQINIVVGILLAYLSNFLITLLHLGAAEWRWEFGVAAIPAVLFFILLFGVPESARWLATKNRMADATDVLRLMGSANAEEELAVISESIHAEHATKSQPVFRRIYMKPIMLALLIGMFNQLSGINAILYYLNDIFAYAGFSKVSGNIQAVSIGAMNLAATVFAMTLIDRIGRKRLLLIGSVGTALCLGGVAAIFRTHEHLNLLVWLLVGYIAFFATSQGAVIWVYIGEVFPNSVRAKGQGIGCSAHWIMNALIAQIFPSLVLYYSTASPFIFFAGMMAVQFVVVLIFFPETKGVSLEDLQRKLGIA
jgi:MFS transporter, SP family, arabinose:H+ symporter